jgi:hypothetical protein
MRTAATPLLRYGTSTSVVPGELAWAMAAACDGEVDAAAAYKWY